MLIDRPSGSKHPTHSYVYEVNYGHVPGTEVPDGEELDAYYLGTNKPLTGLIDGVCIAIVHRTNNDDKLIVVPKGSEGDFTDDVIREQVHFQEQWFDSTIIR